MDIGLKDKVVVITGASSGIGAAAAELLGGRGAHVVLAARRAELLAAVASRVGAGALVVPTNVTSRADVERLRDEALGRLGRIDVWINNAGRGISRPVSQLTDEDIDEMMLVNLKSALYGMQAVLPHFQAQRRGHIINISSMLGRVPLAPVRSAYSASKHALNALTANLRMELAASYPEIHVTTILPGVVATEFGLNARGGGVDSRAIPSAQPVGEVAEVIAAVIAHPRADVYTRPAYQAQVVGYYQAEDMATTEAAILGNMPGGLKR